MVGYLDRAEGTDADLDGDGVSEDGETGIPKGMPQNCAAVLHRGEMATRYAKHHLPNYGVFDEFRIFVPGQRLHVVRVAGVDVALGICEDLWQDGGPVAMTREAGAELLLVLNGSPYEQDKDDARLALVRRRAAEAEATLAYLNLVGGQDDLVFDGDSVVVVAGRRGAGARRAVRRGADRGRPRPAGVAPGHRRGDGVGRADRGLRRAGGRLRPACPHRAHRAWTPSRRSTRRSSSVCASTCARTASRR